MTVGREYYGPGNSYNVFAGRDATVPYITGKFNVEEGAKGLDSLPMDKLLGIESWVEFYREDEKYPFQGLLVDPRYYDEDGNPTPALDEYHARLQTAKQLKSKKAESTAK